MSRNKYPEETVNLILDVSQRLFIEKGYDNTTIQDIIDELGGLTKGAIYHHFSSKQDILDAVIERLFAKNTLSASWRKIQSDTDITGGEKLKRMLAAARRMSRNSSSENWECICRICRRCSATLFCAP